PALKAIDIASAAQFGGLVLFGHAAEKHEIGLGMGFIAIDLAPVIGEIMLTVAMPETMIFGAEFSILMPGHHHLAMIVPGILVKGLLGTFHIHAVHAPRITRHALPDRLTIQQLANSRNVQFIHDNLQLMKSNAF